VERDALALVTVRDSGIGINPAEIPNVFEPYRQIDPPASNGGLGLGLTLVKRFVEIHGGAIEAYSEGLGHGSEFRFTLPLAAVTSGRARPERRGAPPRRLVLVVDDDLDVAQSFANLLEALGQDVLVAHSGRAAIESARTHPPDVAFLDLSMPAMGGEELARHLREEHPNGLHIVALSGFALDQRSAASNFDSHLLKPAAVDSILDVLNAVTIDRVD
jgi:CheY-like chemotaxis protein